MKNWTIILHFGRGHAVTHTNKTKEEIQEIVRITVFSNEDCVNTTIFKTNRG